MRDKGGKNASLLRTFIEIPFLIFFIIVSSVVALTFLSSFSTITGYKIFVVQSGSMEPTIRMGDVIIVNVQSEYDVDNIITFNDSDNRRVTHRITEIARDSEDTVFTTKGDANRTEDNATVSLHKVFGRVVWTIPKLGYVVAFSKTPAGFIALVIIPIILIIYDQTAKLFKRN